MNKYVAEFVGTFFLVLTIGLAAGLGHGGDMAPFVIGSVLTAVIYGGGHISAAHYNPAVTMAFWMRGRCPRAQIPGYVISQMLAALTASLTVGFLAGGKAFAASSYETGPALVAEVLFTFALCWVILNVATSKGTDGNSFYGIAIGLTVVGGAFAVGPISGAVFNPAVAVGACLMGLSDWSFIWVYLVGNLIGAALAAMTFNTFVKE